MFSIFRTDGRPRRVRAPVVGWMLVGLTSLSLTVFGQDGPSFTGSWQRDDERSDNPREKMQEAMSSMRDSMGGGRGGGMPGGGMPGGGAGMPPGGMPGGGGKGGGKRRGQGGMNFAAILEAAASIDIEASDGEFRVDDGDSVQIYYLDGEKHKRELDNGTQLETTAVRRGDSIVIEEKMERGDIKRTFEMAPDGKTLIVTTTFEGSRMKDPVVVRSVYDLVGDTPS